DPVFQRVGFHPSFAQTESSTMTRYSWSGLWSRQPRSLRKDDRRRRNWRPGLEALEDRVTPAVVNWAGPAVGGDWNTPADWSTSSVPVAGDTVSIGLGNTVTFSAGNSRVASLNVDGVLNVVGGNLTVGNTAGTNFTVTTGGTLSGAGTVAVD